MIFAVLLTFSLGAADAQTVVLVGRRTSLSQAEAEVLSRTISTHLTGARVPLKLDADAARASLARLGLKDASACNGRKACVTELGRQLQATYVIALSLSQVGSDRSIALELLRVSDGVVLEKEALILATGANVTADQLAGFSTRVLTQLGVSDKPVVEPPPVPVVKGPLVVVKEPAPVTLTTIPPPPKSHVTSIVLGGAGVVALAVATGLLVSGLNGRAAAYATTAGPDGALRSPYSASEVQRRAGASGVELGVAGGLAAAGLGLGTAALLLLATTVFAAPRAKKPPKTPPPPVAAPVAAPTETPPEPLRQKTPRIALTAPTGGTPERPPPSSRAWSPSCAPPAGPHRLHLGRGAARVDARLDARGEPEPLAGDGRGVPPLARREGLACRRSRGAIRARLRGPLESPRVSR